jgi:selenobiotic family peptide radical SAM maturase
MRRHSPTTDPVFPHCERALGRERWKRFRNALGESIPAERLSAEIASRIPEMGLSAFLSDLASVEWTRHKVSTAPRPPVHSATYDVNPTLELLHLSWKVSALFVPSEGKSLSAPEAEPEWVAIWQEAESGQTRVEAASADDLLAVKIAAEEMSPEDAAREGAVSVGKIHSVLLHGVRRGLLIGPPSSIRRDTSAFAEGNATPEILVSAHTFTLQWHITHACDLRCKHCYDRSRREAPPLEQAVAVLDDMLAFCRSRNVAGHVCFTGGNPLLYPQFLEVYGAAAQRGFNLSLLGNACTRKQVEEIVAIQRPVYYQVGLEGLEEHNDRIRGKGYYARVMNFLDILRELGVSGGIMLTLTKDNLNQVLPLAQKLKGRVDHFTFNRLSQVGEGAGLELPSREEYAAFLQSYVAASRDNPMMNYKDNLLNIVLHNKGEALFDGCTGFGCGAAFNFVALLPDGEVHACRKFPSLVGNIYRQTLSEIHESPDAARYRTGSSACQGCVIRHACGGCMAVSHGQGMDAFIQRDPFCFIGRG